ncbi:hypothetical protein DMUE_6380, partial [Dictyocoela muelleri]
SPSRFGQFTESIFDEYPIYKYSIPPELINEYLPSQLQSFADRTLKNVAKHYFFYSKFVIIASRSQLNDNFQCLSHSMCLSDLLKDLLKENISNKRFNFVLTGNSLMFVRIPRTRHISFHLLCKHLILTNRSNDIRFAGEFWKDDNHVFRLNDD